MWQTARWPIRLRSLSLCVDKDRTHVVKVPFDFSDMMFSATQTLRTRPDFLAHFLTGHWLEQLPIKGSERRCSHEEGGPKHSQWNPRNFQWQEWVWKGQRFKEAFSAYLFSNYLILWSTFSFYFNDQVQLVLSFFKKQFQICSTVLSYSAAETWTDIYI